MKKIFVAITILCLLGCNGLLDDMRPHNQAEADSYLNTFDNLVNATSGLYGQFLRQAGGFANGNHYHGTFHVLGEFRGNCVIINEAFNGSSGDAIRCPDAHFYLNSDQKNQSLAWPMWAKSHQLILGASKNIIAIDKLYKTTVNPQEKSDLPRLKGENLFIRGLMIFNAVNVFGRPYWDNPETNPGIPLDTLGTGNLLPRSTLKESFNQAIADFKQAASLLPDEVSDRTFANKAACYGMLSRIYLFMGGTFDSPDRTYNELAVKYADSTFTLQNDVVEILRGEAFSKLYENPKTSTEILFAFWTGNYPSNIGNAIHSYYSWSGYESNAASSFYTCVISRDYEKIMDKNNDLRWRYFTEPSTRHSGRFDTKKYNGGKVYSFSDYASFLAPTIFIRVGEVILGRAEAHVKLGNNTAALIDLNTIRERAGLTPLSGLSGEALFDEIFLERRREMAFEATTYYDYVRNGIKLTREETTSVYSNYIGSQYNEMDPRTSKRTTCLIPYEELTLNPQLIQNEQ